MAIYRFEEDVDVGAYAFKAGVPIDTSLLPEGDAFGFQLLAAGAVEVHAKPPPKVEKTVQKRPAKAKKEEPTE